jgi:pimeloyl-ACP methyl ester carboxylesterase
VNGVRPVDPDHDHDPSRPVLLVHGFTTSARRTWQEPGWVDLLREAGRTVIAPDLLGHGDAAKPHDPAAYAEVEQLVAAQLPVGRPVDAIGYSAGARVVLALAADDPTRFGRMVLGGIGGGVIGEGRPDGGAGGLRRAFAEKTEDGDDIDPVALRFRALAERDGNDARALAAFLARQAPSLDRARLAQIPNPALVVLGDQDFAAPGEPLADALPNGELVVLPRVDHFGLPKDFGFVDRSLAFLGAEPPH